MLLTEGQQQTISSLRVVPDEAIQFQHIYLYLLWKLHFHSPWKTSLVLIFLEIHFYNNVGRQ